MEKVQIIPPPKDVDHRVLIWKGAAVLGKMDGVSELWVTPSDWVRNAYFAYCVNLTKFIGCIGDAGSQRKVFFPINSL